MFCSDERACVRFDQLQAEMFDAVTGIGVLDVQLLYFRGLDECRMLTWTSDPRVLRNAMERLTCRTGPTQIERALDHVRKEHRNQPVNACVVIGDMCEEPEYGLRAIASDLGVPLMMVQEGDDQLAARSSRRWPASAMVRTCNFVRARQTSWPIYYVPLLLSVLAGSLHSSICALTRRRNCWGS
jgi:hypothetical protein